MMMVSNEACSLPPINSSKLAPRMKIRLVFFLVFLGVEALAQDIGYAKEVLQELCSDEMAGRGYVEDGDNAAAYYIEQEFKQHNLYAWNYNYYQPFSFPVNTFPGKVSVEVDGVTLEAGSMFIVEADAPSIKGKFDLQVVNELPEIAPSGRVIDSTTTYKGVVVVPDSLLSKLPPPIRTSVLKGMKKSGAKAIVRIADEKLTWSVSKQQAPIAQITVLKEHWPKDAKQISFNIEANLEKRHRTQNVVAFVEGTEFPDSFLVFTAHYDHLGKMGKDVIFRGANDNASGISMLLNLAKYYGMPENQPKYSIAFIAFAGEELGLEGSFHYVQKPVFPLSSIRFLVNLDIMGTGDDGITVVNGSVHEEEFAWLTELNAENQYLVQIKKRGKAAISDHYPFSEAGVPCFYMYTMGGIQAYHDVYDVPETLPLTEFEDIFRLLTHFVEKF
ncbi:MAG: M28 family peptidase [Bacteroidetes bacterium]|nr:MAG: M28 family peptidase [Bacteroidota bacterium]